MYFQPKDGYPNMPKYGIFSVGDIVNRKGSATLGHIVRIYNPKWSDAPHITVEWFGNASIGDHDSSNLELYMTRQQWLDDIAKRKKEVEDDKARRDADDARRRAERKAQGKKKTFQDVRNKNKKLKG